MVDVLTSLLHGTIAGIIYSLMGYLRNNGQAKLALKSTEKLSDEALEQIIQLAEFDLAQFIVTIIQGVIVGLVSWLFTQAGIPLTVESAYNILLQVGLLTLTRKLYGLLAAHLAILRSG